MTAADGRRLSLLLLSGGLDSTALAARDRPDLTLFVDYGQRPARAEARAAGAVAAELGLPHARVRVDATAVGSGLMSATESSASNARPSPEWWPFRNQLLVTVAAAWLVRSGHIGPDGPGADIAVGSVRQDGRRHLDGTAAFYAALDALLRTQEFSIGCVAPALDQSTEDLVTAGATTDAVLGWTHSCHVADAPCMACPGCHKREQVLDAVGRLR